MRIAMICSHDSWGGLEQNTVKTTQWLREAGIDISLIVQEGTRVAQAAQKAGIPTLAFTQKGKHKVWKQARNLATLLQNERFDTLVIAHWKHLYLCGWAKYYLKNNLHLIFWQHMQMAVRRRDIYHASFYKKIDKWITPLPYLRAELKRNTTLRDEQIIEIPQVIDTQAFYNVAARKQEARLAYKIPQDAFVVGTIGRIDAQKGQEFLVRAIAILKQKNLPIRAMMMGANSPDNYLAVLQNLVREHQLENEVSFLSFAEEIQLAFAALDIFVMCSLSEPIGMVTVEAMAAGVPVIGTNTGGTPELLAAGEAGLLVPPKSPEALAEAIEKLYFDANLRAELAGKAQKIALQKYNIDTQVKAFKAVFEGLGGR